MPFGGDAVNGRHASAKIFYQSPVTRTKTCSMKVDHRHRKSMYLVLVYMKVPAGSPESLGEVWHPKLRLLRRKLRL